MRLHQVLTGAANVIEDHVAVAHGNVSGFPFTVYGSGYEVVILDSHFNRVQIISSHAVTLVPIVKCIACSCVDGKIAVSFDNNVIIYISQPVSASVDGKLPFLWKKVTVLNFLTEVQKLCWDPEGKRLLVGSSSLHVYRCDVPLISLTDGVQEKWKCVWRRKLAAPPKFLEFSPDGHFFASASQKDCMVKIWFRAPNISKHDDPPSATSSEAILSPMQETYNFIYILHPAAVQSFSWRLTSKYVPLCSVPNVLLTSCADNVCRIWAETVKYKPALHNNVIQEKSSKPNLSAQSPQNQTYGKERSDSEFKTKTEAELKHEEQVNIHQRYHLVSMFHFHLAAVINPASDIALLSAISAASIFGRGFQLQWLNNKEVQLTTSVEAIYETLKRNSTPDSYNNDDTNETDLFSLVHDVEGEMGYQGTLDTADKTLDRTLEGDEIEKDVVYEKTDNTDLDSSTDSSEERNVFVNTTSMYRSQVNNLLHDWCSSSDTLYCIHPADGSLLIWVVDHLDDFTSAYYRQVQVSFASRVPATFSKADASSLCWSQTYHIIQSVHVTNTAMASVVCSSFSRQPSPRQQTNKYVLSKKNVKKNNCLSVLQVSYLVSAHADGSLNLWLVTFSESGSFTGIASITHITRSCGPRFETTQLVKHPELPLIIGTSKQTKETPIVSFETLQQKKRNPKLADIKSELILWHTSHVSPLSEFKGVTEMARISSSNPNKFYHLAWVPILYQSSLVSITSESVELIPLTPCACFVAASDSGLVLYQILLDAKSILSHISAQQISPLQAGKESLSDFIDSEQSGSNSACIMELCVLDGSTELAKDIVFLHIYNKSSLLKDGLTNDSSATSFYVVAVTKDLAGQSIFVWHINTTSNDQVYMKSLESPKSVYSDSSMSPTSPPGFNISHCLQQKLIYECVFGVNDNAAFFASAADIHCSINLNLSCPVHYNFLTAANDSIKFWDIHLSANGDLSVQEVDCLRGIYNDGNNDGVNCSILCIACASTDRFAYVCKKGTGAGNVNFILVIKENESSGELAWSTECNIIIKENVCFDPSIKCDISWLALGDGSYLIAVAAANTVYVYCQTRSFSHDHTISTKWESLKEISLTCGHEVLRTTAIAWASGFFMIGVENEIQVYSKWEDNKKLIFKRLASVIHPSTDDTENCGDGVIITKNTFHDACNAMNNLPQYHPDHLVELLNIGKMRRVRAVLKHLLECVAGKDSSDAAAEQEDTHEIPQQQRTRARTRSLSIFSDNPNLDISISQQGNSGTDILIIPPLPLTALRAADKDESASCKKDPLDDAEGGAKKGTGMASSAVYYGVAQAKLLTEQLSRKQLPGLTSQEQMYLIALSDTVSSTNFEFETLSLNEMKYVRQESVESGLLGGGGGGYATAGATSVGSFGSDTLDDCGLRFLLHMRRHTALTKSSQRQKALSNVQGMPSSEYCWAFHSDCREELLATIPSMVRNESTWAELKVHGVGWWVRSNDVLRRAIEKVAKAQFQATKDPLDCAVFYLAMKKKTLLCALYRSMRDTKMSTFFGNDFTQERWRKAALKNAYVLLGKQRFEHAVAFFLLGNALWDAVQICVSRLNDIQLAMVIVRLFEGYGGMHTKIIQKYILGLEEEPMSTDPFHCSLGRWILKDYGGSLDVLLEPVLEKNPFSNINYPSVFNFYHYLRSHPHLRRRHLAQYKGAKPIGIFLSALSQCTLRDRRLYERKLYFRTACTHLNSGLPDIALEVLLLLPSSLNKNQSEERVDVPLTVQQHEYTENMIITGTFNCDFKSNMKTEDIGRTNNEVGFATTAQSGTFAREMCDVGKDSSGSNFLPSRFADLDEEYKIGISLSDSDDDDDDDDSDDDDDRGTYENSKTNANAEIKPALDDANDAQDSDNVFDTVALNMKYTCVMRCLIENIKVLPLKCAQENSKLRTSLNALLENELEYLHKNCDYGRAATDELKTDRLRQSFIQQQVEELRNTHRAFSVSSIASSFDDDMSIGEKVEKVALHSGWLKRNQQMLTSLYQHCLMIGSGDPEIPAVCLELLLLLHEIEGHRVLSSPLTSISAGPSAPPLLLASMSPYSLVTGPTAFLQSMAHDLLQTVIDLPSFPTPDKPVTRLADLENLMYSLSSCIYHSLCGGDDDPLLASIRKGETTLVGKQMKDGKLCRLPYGSTDVDLDVTSAASQWPGVKFFLSILTASNKDGSQNLKLLLCEAAIAVYLSMFVSSASRLACNNLSLLVLNALTEELWQNAFGGGTKVVVPVPELGGKALAREDSVGSTRTHDAARMRWNYKLLGKESSQQESQKQKSVEESKKLVRHEVFIPPTTRLSDYFMTKRENAGFVFNYDFEDDDEEEEIEEMTNLTLHSPVEDDGFIDESKLREIEKEREKERAKLFEHFDSSAHAWLIMRLALIKTISLNISSFLTLAGFDMADLPTQSPLLYNASKILLRWEQLLTSRLDVHPGVLTESLINYIPALDDGALVRGGATLQRVKILLNPNHTPFSNLVSKSKPAKRLWHLLVQQESLREIFLHYVFKSMKYTGDDETDFQIISGHVLHKDPESVTSFSLNKSNLNYIAVSTMHEIIEYDITGALAVDDVYHAEINRDDSEKPKGKPAPLIIQRRPCSGIRRIDSHPTLPYYITGGTDGSVRMFEFVHPDQIAQFRGAGQHERVNKVQFNPLGNKFAAVDDGGYLSMWLAANTIDTSPYLMIKCHAKHCLDFAYLGSSSLIATVGGSGSEKKSICIWDTLLPPKKALVQTLAHNVYGASSLAYVPGQQCLVTGGKHGDVCVFDIRQRRMLYTFVAHESVIKTIAVDPSEQFFATGSHDGDIKIWGLAVHELFESYPKEHAKATVSLRNVSPGVQCLYILETGQLFSCGGDGTLRWRLLDMYRTQSS